MFNILQTRYYRKQMRMHGVWATARYLYKRKIPIEFALNFARTMHVK